MKYINNDCEECGGLGYTLDPHSDKDFPCVQCGIEEARAKVARQDDETNDELRIRQSTEIETRL